MLRGLLHYYLFAFYSCRFSMSPLLMLLYVYCVLIFDAFGQL